ncbi:hypothetical protein [Oceanibacterium hippocampi]|uniref:Transposase n=1 Tax=Oceanibacterium hippocampi TaxID=745714 RepID=A0A1Y5TVL3_9PROT|nr:hypothetical protein [Oceanibacterium hippocampi]SLN73985.1 hypothetical protein OCH7691_03688 [Oceanibacterium hippocampi]
MTKRKQHKSDFMAHVALEAVMGEQTVADLVSRFGVHATMTHQCEKALLEEASAIFRRSRASVESEVNPVRIKQLHAKIAELTVGQDFLEHGLRLLPGGSAWR